MHYLSKFIICSFSQIKQKYKNYNKISKKQTKKQTKDANNIKTTSNKARDKKTITITMPNKNIETITNWVKNKLNKKQIKQIRNQEH